MKFYTLAAFLSLANMQTAQAYDPANCAFQGEYEDKLYSVSEVFYTDYAPIHWKARLGQTLKRVYDYADRELRYSP